MSDNKKTKQEWAPARIWLQRGVGDDGSHTWCSDSQGEHEQAEYVRVDVQAPAVEAKSYDPFNPIDGVISNKAPAVEAAREATCATCKGLGVVDDGEITGSGGVEFENGPIKCFKDCPQCVGKRHVVEAGARDEREDFEAAMEKHGRMRPFTRWPSDDSYTDDRIEWARRGWLAALARASESAEVPAGYKLVPAEPTVEMLNAALPHDVTFGHGFKRRIYQEMIAAAPQPASEQQPIPQVFIDNGDASRKAFGQTVFAGMSNSDDLWPVWLDGWLRASEQQAARGLSDDDDCPSTPASERAAFNAMMRWHLIRLLQAWRYGGDMSAVALAAFEWARTNSVGKEAFKASERAVILAAKGDGQ